ncbi:unnamed protein product, partial [Ectocarpus sp. 12 AP-2014]
WSYSRCQPNTCHPDDVCSTFSCFSFGYIQTDYYGCGDIGYDCQDVDSACYGCDPGGMSDGFCNEGCVGDFISDGWCDEGELH